MGCNHSQSLSARLPPWSLGFKPVPVLQSYPFLIETSVTARAACGHGSPSKSSTHAEGALSSPSQLPAQKIKNFESCRYTDPKRKHTCRSELLDAGPRSQPLFAKCSSISGVLMHSRHVGTQRSRVAANNMVQLVPGSLAAHTRTHVHQGIMATSIDFWMGIERRIDRQIGYVIFNATLSRFNDRVPTDSKCRCVNMFGGSTPEQT